MNINNRFDQIENDSIIPGQFPSDGSGQSCGRLGGLVSLFSNGFQKFAQIYSRKECNLGSSYNNTVSYTHLTLPTKA